MTRPRLDGKGTKFGRFLREHPRLDAVKESIDVQDLDMMTPRDLEDEELSHLYMLNRFKIGEIMLIEEKQSLHAKSTPAQLDSHGVLFQFVFAAANIIKIPVARYWQNRTQKFTFRGYYLVKVEHGSEESVTDVKDGVLDVNGVMLHPEEFVNFVRGELEQEIPAHPFPHLNKKFPFRRTAHASSR